jgi:asparagine synthase (glutamine-hydrolysing)
MWMVGEFYDFYQMEAPNDTIAMAALIADKPDSFYQYPGMYHAISYEPPYLRVHQDMLGKKPIYYNLDLGVMASEIKAITYLMDEVELNESYLDACNRGVLPHIYTTPYSGIYQINPNQVSLINVENGMNHTREYGEIGFEFNNNLHVALKDAVHKRSVADVPMGMLLSGGLDSSIIYTMLKNVGRAPEVYHIENDEEKYLDLLGVSNAHRLDYHNGVDMTEMLYFAESPMDFGSLIPQYLLGKQDTPYVMISGDGADELFSGYKRAQQQDTQMYDMGELKTWHLPRLDKLMMMGTIELRCPFLDEEVVKFALHSSWKERVGKKQLKLLAEDVGVPESIIHRDKHTLKSPQMRQSKIEWQQHLVAHFRQHFSGGLHEYRRH